MNRNSRVNGKEHELRNFLACLSREGSLASLDFKCDYKKEVKDFPHCLTLRMKFHSVHLT